MSAGEGLDRPGAAGPKGTINLRVSKLMRPDHECATGQCWGVFAAANLWLQGIPGRYLTNIKVIRMCTQLCYIRQDGIVTHSSP